MDPVDRLAAYLAGDLDTAETTAVEQELARDPALRAQVDAMRRADDALGQLPTPPLPDGFEDRLHERLRPELATQLQGSTAEPAPASTFDELATRRAERDAGRRLRWAPALGGVAAAALAVIVVVNLGSGDDSGLMSADMDVAEDTDDGAAGEMFAEDQADDEAAEMGAPMPEGPAVVASGREFDQESLDELRYSPDVDDVAAQGLDADTGRTLAGEWQAAFGLEPEPPSTMFDAEPGDDADSDDAVDDDAAVEERAEVAAAPLRESGRELQEADRDDIERCLADIVAPGLDLIPAYVELGTLDGEDVLVFGLVSIDPGTDAFTHPQIRVAERGSCEIISSLGQD